MGKEIATPEELLIACESIKSIFNGLIAQGFTRKEAIELIKGMLPKIGVNNE